MRKVFTLIVFCFLGSLVSNAQTWNWAKSFENFNGNKTFLFLSPLAKTNFVIGSGKYEGVFYSMNDTLSNINGGGIFVSKIDEQGQITWLKELTGDQTLSLTCQKIDGNGNIYIGGNFSGIGLSAGDTTIFNQGQTDGFIAKFDSSGNFIWLKNISSVNNDFIIDFDIDVFGNIYVLGNTKIDNNPSASLFILKLDSLCNTQKVILGKYFYEKSAPIKLFLRNEDEIFIAGSVIGSIFINNEVVIQNLDTYASFFIKFNSDLAIENTFVSEPSLGVVDIIFGNNNIYIYDYQFYYVDSVANPVFYYPKLKKLDFEYNTLWTKIINEKSFPNNGGTGFINDIPLKSIIDNNGNLISMFSSLSYKFLFGGDSSGYSTNFSSLFSYNYENYLIQIDSNGNDLGFYDFKSDLGSSGITITSMYNGNIVTAGEYRDSIFNIGPYELLNPEPLNREIIVHGSFIYSRKAYTYLASLKFSPTTGLISNQTSSLPSKLYPNPSNNFIKIKFEQPLKANSELIVFSIDGKLMTKQNFPSGTSEIHLDVSSFPKGMYLAGVQSGDERVIHKFLKE